MTSKTKKDRRSTSLMTALRSRWQTATTSSDEGLGMTELLVSMGMAVVLAVMVAAALRLSVHNGADAVSRIGVHADQLDASSLLARDVAEAVYLHTSTATELNLSVVRDGVCWNRSYKVEQTELTITTLYFEQKACRGPSEARTETLVTSLVKADTFFTYYTGTGTVLGQPINDLRSVKRITWDLASSAKGWTNPLTYSGAAVFKGQGDHTGTGVDALQARRALLTITTGTAEGKAAPVLSWTDPNPSGLVSSWVLFRAANPEGAATTDADRGNWQQVGPTHPVGTLTWTDTTLPDGYTATYVVRPNLSDGGRGPESNAVVSGLRPVAPTGLTATGQTTSVALAWTASVGATGYDLYRDDTLVAHTTATTITDKSGVSGWTGSGYGHSHSYKVVATSRWEALTTTGAQDGVVALGATAAQTYPRIGSTRLFSAQAGAFTAPAAPTVTVTPNADWSFTLAWSPAAWVGSGPTTLTAHRDRGWTADVNASGTSSADGTWSGLWGGAENARTTTSRVQSYTQAQVAGQYRHYRIATCNAIGCSPESPVVTGLQRPPTPASCTTSGATTRSMTVTVNAAASVSPYTGYRVTGGAGAADGTGTQAGASFGIDRLTHASGHTFTAYSQNASAANGGFSDSVSCSGATAALTIGAPTVTARTTRSISAQFTAGNGSDRSLTLEGVGTSSGTSGTWDPLADGTGFTLTARNGDGYNEVAATASTSTVGLTSPSCSVSGGGTGPSGTITVSASGSNGTRQVNAAGTGWYTASSRTVTGLGAGTFYGSARATDGHNTTSTRACGSVTVTSPPPPASPWSGTMPTCSQVSRGQIQSTWLATYSAYYFTPVWSEMEFKALNFNDDGTVGSISWRILAEHREKHTNDTTSGVARCGGGGIGV